MAAEKVGLAFSGESEIISDTNSSLNDTPSVSWDGALTLLDPYTISGLVLSNTTYNVSSGYTTLDTTINVGGTLNVMDGGQANDTVINNCGAEILASGAVADLTTVNWGGGLHVYSGATASRTTVNQSGYLGVGDGATAVSTTVGDIGEVTIWGGGVASQTVINTWGAMILSSGARADGTDIRNRGGLHVYSGAVADHTTVNHGGIFGVGDGAVVNNTSIGVYGELTVWGGGVANQTDIAAGGALILLSGAQASGTEIQSDGGLHVYSGAMADSTTVYQGGYFGVGDGAVVSNTTIDVYGELKVWGGGLAADSVISSGGAIILLDNADADGTVISSGGGLHVYSGARASRTTVNQGGYFGVGGGANVISTTVGEAGEVIVWGGGYAADSVIETWGAMILSSGARADRTDIHVNGGLHIYGGAVAGGVTIREGATLGIGGGGTVDSVIEEYGAGMVFYDGAQVSGRIQMGGTVTVNGVLDGSDAMFVFDLSDRTSEDGVILNSMSAVSNANYQVSLSGLDALGQYALAGDASGFSGSITVTVNSQAVGDVTVGGPALIIGDLACSLFRSGSDTLLFDINVVSPDTPPEFPDFAGQANIDSTGAGTLSWTAATDDSGTISRYEVSIYNESGNLINTLTTNTTSVNVSGLTTGSYSFDVRAFDDQGNSTLSEPTAFYAVIAPARLSGGLVQVYYNGFPVLTQTTTLSNYNLSGGGLVMHVQSAGNTVSASISNNAFAAVFSGGFMSSTQVLPGGFLFTENGGTAEATIVNGGGIIASSGAFLRNTDFSAGQMVLSGGTAQKNTIRNGVYLFIESGGRAYDNVLVTGGRVVVNQGGKIIDTEASSGTLVHLSSGGRLDGVVLHSGAILEIERDTVGTNISLDSGAAGLTAEIDPSTILTGTSGGVDFTISNGVVSGVNWSGNVINISSGIDLYLSMCSGTLVESSVLHAGHILAYSGAVVSSNTLHYYAQMNVYSNAVASGIVLDSEAELYAYGGQIFDTTVDADGYVWISSEGKAFRTTVNYLGRFDVGSIGGNGGFASDTVVNSGGYFQVISNTSAAKAEVNYGGTIVIDTGRVTNTNLGGLMIVKYTGLASDTEIFDGGRLQLFRAGSATNTIVNGGVIDVTGVVDTGELNLEKDREKFMSSAMIYTSGGFLSGTVMNSGYINLLTSGIAQATVVYGGDYNIQSGGSALDTTLSGGVFQISSCGFASNVILYDGFCNILDGAVVSQLTVQNAAGLIINPDVTITEMTVKDTPVVHMNITGKTNLTGKVNETEFSCLNGQLTGYTVLESGIVSISSGVEANSLQVQSGGILQVRAGAALSETTVLTGGTVALTAGVVHRGHIVLETDASFQANQARIDFTLSGISPSNSNPLIVNQKYLYSGKYTISVTSDQQAGNYLLATGCTEKNDPMGGLTNQMGLYVDDQLVGNVSLGQALNFNSRIYSLTYNADSLSLSIVGQNSVSEPWSTASDCFFEDDGVSAELELSAVVPDELQFLRDTDDYRKYNLLS